MRHAQDDAASSGCRCFACHAVGSFVASHGIRRQILPAGPAMGIPGQVQFLHLSAVPGDRLGHCKCLRDQSGLRLRLSTPRPLLIRKTAVARMERKRNPGMALRMAAPGFRCAASGLPVPYFPNTVIANEAKQSMAPQAEAWIASSLARLAMTAARRVALRSQGQRA